MKSYTKSYVRRPAGFHNFWYISIVCLMSSGTIFIYEERLQISEAGRKQKELI